MAQKFIGLDDAAQQLSISKDDLNRLREEGKLRAYRDGASWKFRAEDIDQMAAAGVPSLEPSPSALDLEAESEISVEPAAPAPSGVQLDLDDEEIIDSGASDIDLEDEDIDEPTVPAGVSSIGLGDELSLKSDLDVDQSAEDSDSILLSEAELGTSTNRPPSTIIGKAELDPESDLALAGDDESIEVGPVSDVQLAPSASTSDVLGMGAGEDVFGANLPSPSRSFEEVEELEVDLEAESSRILGPEDVSKAKAAADVARAAATSGELDLAPGSSVTDVGSDIALGSERTSGSLTGLSALELETDEDEQVLGEGSDITLSTESSGINIISPSDSGLALDEVPLDLSGGGSIGSSLELGEATQGAEMGLEPLEVAEDAAQSGVESFQLTPLGEEAGEEEKDSSQVIALEEISEEEAEGLGEPASLDTDMLSDEFVGVGGGGLGTGAGIAAVEPSVETAFPTPVIVFLSMCIFLLAICGMMVFDLIRNMWSWDQVYSVNSSLLETLYPLIN